MPQQQGGSSGGLGTVGTALLAGGAGLAGGALLSSALRPDDPKTVVIHQEAASPAASVAPVAAAPAAPAAAPAEAAPAPAPAAPAAPGKYHKKSCLHVRTKFGNGTNLICLLPFIAPAPAVADRAAVDPTQQPSTVLPGPYSPPPPVDNNAAAAVPQVPLAPLAPLQDNTSAPLAPLPEATATVPLAPLPDASAPLPPSPPLPIQANPCQPDANGMVPVSCIQPSPLAITAAPPLIHSSASEPPVTMSSDLRANTTNNTTTPGRSAATTFCIFNVTVYSVLALILAKLL